ncbi:MAG: cell cycle protein, partial [Pedobacter sp.]
MQRTQERIFLVLITIVLGALFGTLYTTLQAGFADVETRLQNGTMVNLNAKNPGERMSTLLRKGYYFEDKKDIQFIESAVSAGAKTFDRPIDNVGEVNKKKFFVVADQAFVKGGINFKDRVADSRALLGYTGDDSKRFMEEQQNPPILPAVKDFHSGEYVIQGKIIDQDKKSVPNVLVKLSMILPLDSGYIENDSISVKHELIEYLRTDANGTFRFEHLPNDKAFVILPLRPGYQYGKSQGTEELNADVSFTFTQSPHTIRLFSAREFKILKKEKSLIVRTVDEFNQWFWVIMISFITGFWLLHLFMTWKQHAADQLVLPLVMLMTGISFITLLSLQDPLRDRFLAKDMLVYMGIGLVAMLVMLLLKLRRFNTDSWIYRMLFFKNVRSAANGWPWIVLAIGLLALTIRFGTGPEGSGVKVNLFGFQPSEIVKYLIIFFLAGFFAVNEKLISEYATWTKRGTFFSFALIAILVTLMLFLLLGDLGPAMVVCFTFIMLFSF